MTTQTPNHAAAFAALVEIGRQATEALIAEGNAIDAEEAGVLFELRHTEALLVEKELVFDAAHAVGLEDDVEEVVVFA